MRRLRCGSEGFAVITALLVLVIMLGLGLALASTVDVQSHQSGRERGEESAFNLAEAALDDEVLQLAQRFPSGGLAYPSQCSSAAMDTAYCPASTGSPGAKLLDSFQGADYRQDGWVVKVRDDGQFDSTATYSPAPPANPRWDNRLLASAPSSDANGNGSVWVWAQSTAAGQTKHVVALAQVQAVPAPFPQNVITAGYFQTGNNGYHSNPIVTEGGYNTSLAVRNCSTGPRSSCLDYPANRGQVDATADPGLSGQTAVDAGVIAGFKQLAQSSGEYSATSTTNCQFTADHVYLESASCSFTGNSSAGGWCFQPDKPCMLVIANPATSGSPALYLGGNVKFYGLVYVLNTACANAAMGANCPSSGPVVVVKGNATLNGAIAVDYGGGVQAGDSGGQDSNVAYDPNVFNLVATPGGAAITDNSFRQLPDG